MIKKIVLDAFKGRYSYIQVLTFLLSSAILTSMIQKDNEPSGWIWFMSILIVGNAIDFFVRFFVIKEEDSTE